MKTFLALLALAASVLLTNAAVMPEMATGTAQLAHYKPGNHQPVCAFDGQNAVIFQSRRAYQEAALQSSQKLHQIPLYTCQSTDPNVNIMDPEQMQQINQTPARVQPQPLPR